MQACEFYLADLFFVFSVEDAAARLGQNVTCNMYIKSLFHFSSSCDARATSRFKMAKCKTYLVVS